MNLPPRSRPHRAALGLMASLVTALGMHGTARADGDRASARIPPSPALTTYTQECSACHIAYPPGMLPAASWQRLMSHLPRHFGTDASLDPATVAQLSGWLAVHAGTYRRVGAVPPEDRITSSAWFVRQHDEVAAATWKRPAVKSAAHCAACHTRADQGDFDEDHVRIPG